MDSSTQTSVFQIINTSSKGLWPPSENVTLVQASSREAIIQAIVRGQDIFIEKRLTPCHQYLSCLIKNFRGDPADSDEEFEPDPDALHKGDSADVESVNYTTCFILCFCREQSNLLCN